MKIKTIKSVLASIIAAASFVAFGIEIGSQLPGSDHSSDPCTPKQHTGDYQTQHFNADISGSQGKEFDVVLFGDSITDFWNNPNLALDGNPNNYATSFNMGIGSERVQNILWRLRNGALNGYTTKYFTLMVGINNGHQKCIDHNDHADRPEDVAESIRLMLCEMATKHPDAKILLMPILPYSFDSKYFEAAEVTAMSEAVNDYILQFVDNKRVFWVDLRSQYLKQNSMPNKTCYREGGHGGYDAVGLCLHPEFSTYSDFWKPALTNAMHKYLSVPAGQAHVADPSLGYAKAAPNADGAGSATITVFGINLGTDANANAVTSYAIDYELDGGAKTRALSNQTGVRKSFVIPNVALGDHTCKVTVTTADNKELVTLLDFEMTEPWSAEPLPADASAVRTDGTLKYAYACGSYTLNGVTFAAAGNNNANISNDIVWPYSQTSGSTPPSTAASGNYYDLLGHCWWATQGDKKVTLKDLTPGHVYLVQIFGYRNYSGHDRSHVWIKESYWDSNYMKVLGDGWTYGGALTGTLTATEATKTFTIMSDGNYAVNGIQVRDLGESGVALVVQPSISSVSVTTNGTAATVFLSGIALGTDDAGTNANSYAVSYSLNNAAAVTALSGQTAATASFTIPNLADGEYTCAVTITTDANKTSASKSVSFRIGPPPPEVVEPFIGSASVTTNGTTATIAISEITMGTDSQGAAAASYSVSYTLNGGSAVTALSNQSGATASFDIDNLADGRYTCVVTITTDKNKTAETTVSFRIGEPPPITVGWTVGPMSADASTIRTDGDLLYAYAAQDGTVGGVSFVRDAPLGAAGMVSASPVPGMGGGSWETEGVSGDFGTMLKNGWNWTGDGTELSYTLTLAGLTPGKNYMVQLVMHRQSNNMLVSVNGSAQAHLHGDDEAHYKYGASIVGLFTASAATQDLTVTYTERGGDRPLNAIQVRYLGDGGVDPVEPPDPVETPVYTLTIPEKTGLTLPSVTTNGVAVAAAGGSYSIVSNTQVTVTFAAASGYEIVSGNPVVFTMTGAKTFANADYPVVQTTGGGGEPGPEPEAGWTGEAMAADGSSFRTDGTLLYAYAVSSVTVNGIAFVADADLNTADTAVSPDLAQTDGNSGSEDVSGDFGTMLKNSWEWANSTSTLTITLKGLTAGKRYLVQVLAHNKWSDTLISAGDLSPMAMRDTNKYGASLVCVFDATGETEDIAVKYSGPASWRVLNAIQVRELPAGGSGATIVAPSIESASVTTNGTTATVSLSGIVMGTDDEGTNATSYAVSYSLTNAPAVTALSNQSGATASFDIENLADGEYTCEVTITTDKNKTATKSVSFTIGSSGQGGGDDPVVPPVGLGWTATPMSASGDTICTTGALVYAYARRTGTVNTVPFTGLGDVNLGDVYGNISFSFDVGMNRDMNADSSDPYQNLIGHRWVGSSGARTLTLKGLSTGKTYLVQLILNMQDSFAAGACFTAPGDVTAKANGEGWENGGSLVGVFVAGGDTETFSLVSSVYTVLSAIQVRELPEEAPEVDPADIATTCVLRISEVMPKPTDALDRGALEGMDVNGLESGWVEVENTSDKWADLADYRFIRVNRGKKTDTAGVGNFPKFLVKPHGHAVFYTSERYSNSKDKTVSAFEHGTFDGKPMVMGDNLRGILVWGDKVNPKKSPFVRLYYAPGGEISNVVDTVVVPSDLPEGWSIVVGNAAEGEGTRRWMCPTPTRGTANSATAGLKRIGPNVGPVYEKADKKKTDLANEFAAPIPPAVPGTDYAVVLPINPVMNPDGSSIPRAADQIASVKFVYRKDLSDATLVTNAVDMSTLDASDKNWGARYTATIPASYFPAAGHLMQWKVLVTDGEGVEWTSPSFNNKDDGYEWYGTIVEPSADLVSETLPTWHMFADPQSVAQMDYDKDDKQHYTLSNGARVAIYDSSTSNYYDYVRIDLRGNTSKNFTKKSHGLRFAKAHPLTMTDVVTGETIDGIRKTSLTSEYADPSKLRQMMAFWLWRRMGNNAPFHFPVRCNLNGQFYQLAFNTERFTDELIEDVYGLDKYGYGYKNVGTMKSGSGTLAGDIEKKTPDDEDESNITVLQNELRGPIYELGVQNVSRSTAAALSSTTTDPTGLDNAPLTKFVVQKFDLPAWLNYLASARITQEMDDVWANICVYYDNPEMKEGARGTGTWMPLGYDFNETFGQFYRDAGLGQNGISSTDDWFKSHPLYGGHRIQCYTSSAMTTTMAAASGRDYSNYGIESVLQSAKFRRLYLRRLRTLMDQELKEPGTAESDTPVMAKMREMVALMSADAAADSAKWPIDSSAQAIDVWPSSSRPATISAGVDDIWNNYVVPRRQHLYVTHSVTNTARAVGYGSNLNAGIPEAQSPMETLAPNITADLSGLADGVVVISNGNNEVVDMSGWVLKTAVEWTLPAGTVCDAQDAIYVVADRRAYVAAHAEALTDQVIVGNASFTDTAILQVFAADGTTQVLMTTPDSGDPYQANLRFHTIYGSTLNGKGDSGEFIVITNVSSGVVNLEGVEVSCGKAGGTPKCKIVLGDVDLSGFASIRLDQADYAAAGWEKITNGSIAMKIADKTGATVQIGELTFGLCDARTDEGGYALQAKRFDNETPLADSTDDWTAVFVEAAAPDAPVIGGGEGGVAPITVGASSVSINITNAKAGSIYGYKKSTTLVGLKDAPIVYQNVPADADGNLLIEIPRENGETSCFYQIVVE